jgi:cysteine desulfurase
VTNTRTSAPVYLDYNATAPLLPAAREAILCALDDRPGNASSPHAFGQAARDALESHRAALAGHLGFSRREWHFTSGGTESNNAALRWLADLPGPTHLITTPIEHPSILRSAEALAARGVSVSYLPVDRSGRVRADALRDLLRPETRLVSVMAANNETGVLQPLEQIGTIVCEARAAGLSPRVLFHADAVQAFGRVPLPLKAWGVDAATVAAHKLGGPKGIGGWIVREGSGIPAFILGGRQERDRRAGTEPEALAAGFAAAGTWVFERLPELSARLIELRDRLERQIADIPGTSINGLEAPRVPNTANVAFEGVSAQSLVVALDLDGVAVSTGSACSSGALEPSHVLLAMGLPEAQVRSSLRISLGWGTQEEEVDRCGDALRRHVRRLRNAPVPRAMIAQAMGNG